MRLFAGILNVLILAAVLQAQTATIIMSGPITTKDTLAWNMAVADYATPADAQRMELRVRIDGGSIIAVNGFTCDATQVTLDGAQWWPCRILVPQAIVTAMNVRGQHALVATLYDPTLLREGPSAIPFPLTSPPGALTAMSFVR